MNLFRHHSYLSSILVLGFALPLVVLLILGTALGIGVQRFVAEKRMREVRYAKCMAEEANVTRMKAAMAPEVTTLDFLVDLLNTSEGPQSAKLLRLLDSEQQVLSAPTMVREIFKPDPSSRLLGKLPIPSEAVILRYTATYAVLQALAVRIETLMPNLMLVRAMIKPGPANKARLLEFELEYALFALSREVGHR